MKVYVLCCQYDGERGDWIYEQVFSSLDAAKEHIRESEVLDVRWAAFDAGEWHSVWLGDPTWKYCWVILEQEVLK